FSGPGARWRGVVVADDSTPRFKTAREGPYSQPSAGGGATDSLRDFVLASIEKAVVLSAGQGRRLLPLTADRPKCLVELSGRSVLEWQLRALEAAGVREAVVVTGFGAASVDAELSSLDL